MSARSAITIDVDSLRFYREIHGLTATDAGDDPIYTVALPRFFELLSEAGVPATLFLIAADAPKYAAQLAPIADTKSEVASHSFAHDYRLTSRSRAEISHDLLRAHAELLPLCPARRIVGFRAPGYNMSPVILETIAALGYTYDSSFLPSPLYFAARATAIAAYKLLGRPSRSMVGNYRAFMGKTEPFEIIRSLIEIPIAIEPVSRAPLIGTTWTLAPPIARSAMLATALRILPTFNFEMHAIDLLDQSDPGIPPEVAQSQRDLAVPVSEKMSAFRGLFRRLAGETEVTTLAEIARVTSPSS